ncbi:MAG: hypothetical protein IKA31_01570 [Clostridia bacterium]|nr:hypothetical protein [Clostridia bacterium]
MNLLLGKIQAFFQCLDWTAIGICLAVGIVLALVLYFVLKGSLLGKFLAVIVVIASLVLPIGISYKNNYISPEQLEVSKQEYLESITNPDKYLTIQSNGGYDKSYIEQKENEADCPVSDDKYFDINMCEYKDIVVFSYDKIIEGQLCTVNTIFTKFEDKIIFTGCFNVAVDKNEYGGFLGMFTTTDFSFANKMYKGNNFSPLKEVVTKYNGGYKQIHFMGEYTDLLEPGYYDRIFEPHSCALIGNKFDAIGFMDVMPHSNKYTVLKLANEGCYDILENHFEQLDKIGLKLSNEEADGGLYYQLNTFYTAVYNSVSEVNQPETRINVTSFMGDVQDGIVYKSNRYLNVNYLNVDSNAFDVEKNKENEDIINSFVINNEVKVEALPKVVFKLNNKNQTELTGFDITKTPVTILVQGDKTYTLKFDTIEELNNGCEVYLPYRTYTYEINSSALNFDGKYGSVKIVESTKNVLLDYTYEYGIVECSVRLQPIDNVDLTGFDITENPVTIRLSNETQTFEFKFDTVEELNGTITQRLPIGTYEWRISSSELSFSETSGTLEVTVLDYLHEFPYDYKVSKTYSVAVNLSVETGAVDKVYANNSQYRKCKLVINTWNSLDIKELSLRTLVYTYKYVDGMTSGSLYGTDTTTLTTSTHTAELPICPESSDSTLPDGYIQFGLTITTNSGDTIYVTSNKLSYVGKVGVNDLAIITFTITEG